jgi:hypothetical protein
MATKKKARKAPKKQKMRANDSRQPMFKQGLFSAAGAALGALVGAAYYRDPQGVIAAVGAAIKLFSDPATLQSMLSSTIPQAEWPVAGASPFGPDEKGVRSPSDPRTKGCGIPGCPSNEPGIVAIETARVMREHPEWSVEQVSDIVVSNLNAMADAAHAAAGEPHVPLQRTRQRTQRKKKPDA